MKHVESASKKKELFILIRELKDKLFGEFKTVNGQHTRQQAWQEVKKKGVDLGLCKPDVCIAQFKKNCFNNTVQRTREKLRKRNRTGQGCDSSTSLTELDEIVLDVIGRDAEAEAVAVPGGRGINDWATQSPSLPPIEMPESEEDARKSLYAVSPASTASPAPPRLKMRSSVGQRSREDPLMCMGVSRPSRRELGDANRALLAMPEEELTDQERDKVRQILVLKMLKGLAARADSVSVEEVKAAVAMW
ncbi:uncharacterized protein LOC122387153 [Amphibalanus amphitrite]|uniref:uncharacterized protein LOC122387153 n=1 Tax=Amphibalanus amphitrite TaxID=1232801 RepID=UPI001C905DE3|nr:uncharacterized protein LOC122387153 [Amphibalanus amphitrite]